jgi:hypothetical protein
VGDAGRAGRRERGQGRVGGVRAEDVARQQMHGGGGEQGLAGERRARLAVQRPAALHQLVELFELAVGEERVFRHRAARVIRATAKALAQSTRWKSVRDAVEKEAPSETG